MFLLRNSQAHYVQMYFPIIFAHVVFCKYVICEIEIFSEVFLKFRRSLYTWSRCTPARSRVGGQNITDCVFQWLLFLAARVRSRRHESWVGVTFVSALVAPHVGLRRFQLKSKMDKSILPWPGNPRTSSPHFQRTLRYHYTTTTSRCLFVFETNFAPL